MENITRRLFLAGAGASSVLAQDQPKETRIVVQVNEVVVPVTVFDKDDRYVDGLDLKDFRLYDNKKLQNIKKVDVSYTPISLVVAIQANANVEVVLPQIKRIGPMLEGAVLGEQGQAAIIVFDHRIRVLQEFTHDGKLFTKALEQITPGSSTSRSIDAVEEAARMLGRRPKGDKRVLLLIAETQDKGSEGKMRETLLALENNNVQVHTININRAITMVTKKMEAPRQDPYPAGARPVPPGAPQTPSTTEQLSGYRGATTNFVPVFEEIFTQIKGVFFSNPQEVFTRYTGGKEYSFLNQRTLEEAVRKIGVELHSQYLLTYTPNNMADFGGWHDIQVDVARYAVKVRARDGYWAAQRPN